MARTREIVKSVTLRGKAKTSAVPRSLKGIADAARKSGQSAAQAQGKFHSFAGKLDDLNAKAGKMSASLRKVQTLLGAAGLVTAAVGAVKAVDSLVMRSQQLQDVMGNLPFSIGKAQRATGGFVDKMTLAKSAAQAARLGVAKSSDEFARLAGIATKLGRSVGQDANKSVEDLTTALARQSPMILDNLGISLKLSDAYQRYAERVGKSVDALDESEKKLAFQEEAMIAAEAAAANVTLQVDAATESWIQSKTAMKDWADEVILSVLPAVGKAVEGLIRLDEVVYTLIHGNVPRTGTRSVNEMLDNASAQGIDNASTRRRQEQLAAAAEQAALMREAQKYNYLVDTSSEKFLKSLRPKKKKRGGKKRGVDMVLTERDLMSDEEKLAERATLLGHAESGTGPALDELLAGFAEEEEAVRAHEQALAEVRLEQRMRGIEQLRDAGVDPLVLITQEEEARQEFLRGELERAQTIEDTSERKLAVLQIEGEMEANAHDARMRRISAEMQAREELKARYIETGRAIGGALVEAANTANLAAEMGIIGEKRAAGIAAWGGSVRLAFRATELGAEAVGNIASQNYGKGLAQAAAAAFIGGQSVILAAKAAGLGHTGNAHSAGDAFGAGGAFSGASFGPGVPGAANGGPRSGARPGVPASFPDEAPPGPDSQPRSGGGNTYVFQGNLIHGTEEELGLALRRVEEKTTQRFGMGTN